MRSEAARRDRYVLEIDDQDYHNVSAPLQFDWEPEKVSIMLYRLAEAAHQVEEADRENWPEPGAERARLKARAARDLEDRQRGRGITAGPTSVMIAQKGRP